MCFSNFIKYPHLSQTLSMISFSMFALTLYFLLNSLQGNTAVNLLKIWTGYRSKYGMVCIVQDLQVCTNLPQSPLTPSSNHTEDTKPNKMFYDECLDPTSFGVQALFIQKFPQSKTSNNIRLSTRLEVGCLKWIAYETPKRLEPRA